MTRSLPIVQTDVLVIGSEGAGARAALEAAETGCHVTVITKGRASRSGATQCAPGDYAINGGAARRLGLDGSVDDSPEYHYEDTIAGGKYLNDASLARLLAEGAEEGLSYLMDLGVPWTRINRYPGHRFARGAMVGEVGKTGTSIVRGLQRAMRRKQISLFEDTFAVELLTSDSEVTGCLALYVPSGELFAITAKSVVLATGGGSRIFWLTSGPEEVTGDGMALAYRAGADLIDMEFVQFSPFTMIWPSGLRGHQSFVYEYFCVLQSWLMNHYGERFMVQWDPERMERSTRDTLSIGMMSEILAGRGSEHGGVYLSASHLPLNLLKQFEDEYFPGLQVGSFRLGDFGIDPTINAFEVAPGAHFFMGGVRINAQGATTVPGLFAAGEVTGGVHGANRLSGNAITETQVFGTIAGCAAAHFAADRLIQEPDPAQVSATIEQIEEMRQRKSGTSAFEVRAEIQRLAWNDVGVIRDHQRLSTALKKIDSWAVDAVPHLRLATSSSTYNVELMKALETINMVQILRAITIGALSRRKTCGAHYRSDSVDDDPQDSRYVVRHCGNEMTVAPLTVEGQPSEQVHIS